MFLWCVIMASELAPPGVAFLTSFQYSVPSLTSGAFTIIVYKDGAVSSNANVSIAYVSDYEYAVTCAANSFVATAGSYDLVIYHTSTPTSRWSQTIRVDSRYFSVVGNYANPVATFTAVASNGRVTSSGSPISGATVTVLRPNSTILLQAITDSNGLWGTAVFDIAGTHTVNVQRSGYTVGSATIIISGGAATGPGTDVSISATTTTTSITASSLWAYARRMYKDHVGTKADTEIREAVDEALNQVATARTWPWYETVGQVALLPYQVSGTVTLTYGSAVVTLAGATWPATLPYAEIMLPDGLWYEVLTRDSTTQITLTTTWQGTTASAQTYTLATMQYPLPADCRKIDQVVRSRFWVWGPDPVSRSTLEISKRTWISGATVDQLWAIERDRLVVWPYPQQGATINILYTRKPAALVSGSDTADWDPNLLELLYRAIDYQIAARGDCAAGDRQTCLAAYRESLARLVDQDRTSQSPRIGFASGLSPLDSLRYTSRITG